MDKELLFATRLEEKDVPIPGVGAVRVRALSRLEAIRLQRAQEANADQSQVDRVCLSMAMVDPVMTEADVKRWQAASAAGEIERVTTVVAELSGMLPGADKEAYKSFPGGSSDGVRLLPGGETPPDGGGAAPDPQ